MKKITAYCKNCGWKKHFHDTIEAHRELSKHFDEHPQKDLPIAGGSRDRKWWEYIPWLK